MTMAPMIRFLSFLVVALVCACGGSNAPPSVPMRNIVDGAGHEVSVPVKPRRVFADSATGFDLMVELLEPEQIVGVVSTALRYSLAAGSLERWEGLPNPAGFHAADILALDPDLVLVSDWRPPTVPSLLQRQGICVVRLPTPTSYQGLKELIRFSSEALGAVQRGEQLMADLDRRRAVLVANEALKDVRVLSYGNYGAGGSSAGNGTAYDFLIELSGMRNAAAEFGLVGNGPLDLEQMLRMDPDLLLLAEAENGGHSPTLEWLLGQGAAREVRAVKEKRWVILPVNLHSTSSQHIMDAAEALAHKASALLKSKDS